MKKTISIISLIIITGLQAQSLDIAGIDKELAFKLTERVNYKLFDGTTGKGNIEFVEYNGQKYVRLLANDIKNYLITTKFSNYDNLVTWISAFDNVTDAQTLTKIDNAFSHLDNAGLSRINTALEKAGGGIHTEFGELLVKLSEGNTNLLAQIAGSTEWGGNKLSKLAEDLASASNDMLREFVENPNLIDAWEFVSDLPNGKKWVRQNPYILEKISQSPSGVKNNIKEFYRNFTPNGPYPTIRNGINFDKYGFPVYDITHISDKNHIVEILMDGTNQDYLRAYDKLKMIVGEGNIQFTNNFGSSFKIKKDGVWSEIYTWHHHQDGKSMIPVLQSIHSNVSHTGGRSVVNPSRNIKGIFNSPNY